MQIEIAVHRLEDVVGLEPPVREGEDARAHPPFRVPVERAHRVDDGLSTATTAEFRKPSFGNVVRRELRPKIPATLFGIAHLGDESVERCVVEPSRRNDHALIGETRRVGRHRTGLAAADLCPRHERDVREVCSARVRVVEDPDVLASRVVRHHRRNSVRHRAEVDGNVLGLRNHPTARVEERGRAIAPFLDVRRERRVNENGAHLLGDRTQQGAENLELDVHTRVTVHAGPSLTPTHPGGMYSVAPASSIRPGPFETRRALRGRSKSGPGVTCAVRTATSSTSRPRSAKP